MQKKVLIKSVKDPVSAINWDIVSRQTRSLMMGAVRQSDTSPEIFVRMMLRKLGFCYCIKNRNLPGSPDIANRTKGWAIFVHGCFWHGHKNCPKTKAGRSPRVPRTNELFWRKKLLDNRRRDANACRKLRALGFRVLIVWECSLVNEKSLAARLRCVLRKMV